MLGFLPCGSNFESKNELKYPVQIVQICYLVHLFALFQC